ncbi:unnamed protein product [Ambrosiozyma monospora]|uniref:Unnamed protein product n=1 Tax=Ambrosiozyma monospora TaxID=43982 RepID=A0ACB5U2E5_AMBMO|nr:unnamed protein product [Ambrosiozyma monospora]
MVCENNDIHRIPVRLRPMTDTEHEIITSKTRSNELTIYKYFVSDTSFSFYRSQFGRRQVTTNLKRFDPRPKHFVDGLSSEQKADIENRIDTLRHNLEDLEPSLEEANTEYKECRDKCEEAKDNLSHIATQLRDIRAVQEQLKKYEVTKETLRSQIDMQKKAIVKAKKKGSPESIAKIYNQIEQLQISKIDKMQELVTAATKIGEYEELLATAQVFKIQEQNKSDCLNTLNVSIVQKKETLVNEINQISADHKRMKQEAKRAMEETP